ncbi:MAG: MarR family transcriptional regulator [Syntrophus sp. (in: bacteria)]|nr:MarR family transcriptional regulator [Syntrophus sp. (in: bacteria)]
MTTESGNAYEYRIIRALRRVIRAVHIYSKKLNSEFGLTTPQLSCLSALAESSRTTLTDLARMVNLGISTANGIIDRLEAKGYLTRTRSSEDHRKVYLEISQSGREIILKAPSLLQHKLSESLSRLPESEQRVIADSLEQVVKLMEAEKLDVSANLFPGEQSYKS